MTDLATSAVGVAFLLAGLLSKESNRARLVMTLVASAWFLASLIPSAQALHQSMLLIALLVLLPGPQRRLDTIVLLASAAGAALGLVPDAAVAATFLLTAVVAAQRRAVFVARCSSPRVGACAALVGLSTL